MIKLCFQLSFVDTRRIYAKSVNVSLSIAPSDELIDFVCSDCEEVVKTCDICDQDLADELWAKSEEWTSLSKRIGAMQDLKNNAVPNSHISAN